MGSVLACRLRDGGCHVDVFDIDHAARAAALANGMHVAESPAAVAEAVNVLLLCLPDARAVEETIAGPRGVATWHHVPSLCIDLTSSLPVTTRRVGAILGAHGARLIDAPVSGGVAGARAGRLTVMAGGDEETVDAARPLLYAFASNVIWAGSLGSGHAVKAFNNALSAASLVATAETIAAGRAAGIPPYRSVQAINAGEAASENSQVKYPRDILSGTFTAGFRLALLHKDVAGACVIAGDVGVAVPMTECARDILAAGLQWLGPAADMTAIYLAIVPDLDLAGTSPVDEHRVLSRLNVALFGTLLMFSLEIRDPRARRRRRPKSCHFHIQPEQRKELVHKRPCRGPERRRPPALWAHDRRPRRSREPGGPRGGGRRSAAGPHDQSPRAVADYFGAGGLRSGSMERVP